MTIPKPIIIDISEWQEPRFINYQKLAQAIDHVIIRVQYGSLHRDQHYQTHLRRFKELGVPVAVYAWVQGVSITDMKAEAQTFYQRGKEFQPTFYWLDVEEASMTDMRAGVEAYRKELKKISGAQVGLYVAHHLYQGFNLDVAAFDALWLPTYGANSGKYRGTHPTVNQAYDLHQYTSKGHLPGYHGDLDLNRLSGRKNLLHFTGASPAADWGIAENGRFTLTSDIFLRTAPSTTAPKIALLKKGEVLLYDAFACENQHVWLRQKRIDGSYGYLASGEADNQKRTGPAWGIFSE